MPTLDEIVNKRLSPPLDLQGNPTSVGADISIPGEDLLQTASEQAEKLMRGEIPKDVQDQLMQISSERALKQGLGLGQRNRNLVARDLGKTSLDLIGQGISAATQIGQAGTQMAAVKEQAREWDDKFTVMLMEQQNASNQTANSLYLGRQQIAMAASDLISKNLQFVNTLVTNMIISNSQKKISGLQNNINDLLGREGKTGALQSANEQILKLLRANEGALP